MAYDVVNAADLPQETSTTLDGTEQLIGFDTAQGKRVTVNDLAEYILQRKLSSLAGSSQTVAAALTALNSNRPGWVGWLSNINLDDMHTDSDCGTYWLNTGSTAITGVLPASSGQGLLILKRQSSTMYRMVYVPISAGTNFVVRYYTISSGTWSEWAETSLGAKIADLERRISALENA